MQLIQRITITSLLLGALAWLPGCGLGSTHSATDQQTVTNGKGQTKPVSHPAGSGSKEGVQPNADTKNTGTNPQGSKGSDGSQQPPSTPNPAGGTTGTTNTEPVQVVSDPNNVDVLVNKHFALPAGFTPSDLIVPNVPFLYADDQGNHQMRAVAAHALEKLFAEALSDGIHLTAVSGYRSYSLQKSLFDYYVKTQGEVAARQYSAEPGESEHQTGLAMDVAGSTTACAVDDCWADTPEAAWLDKHAQDEGFIVRYEKGKEAITGYAFEPWHIRYVGISVAKDVVAQGLTFDQYIAKQRSSSSP